jgi:hypothetical protein
MHARLTFAARANEAKLPSLCSIYKSLGCVGADVVAIDMMMKEENKTGTVVLVGHSIFTWSPSGTSKT